MTDQPIYWYYDPEHRTAPVRQLPWGIADQCNMSAPFQTQEAAEQARQHALTTLLSDLATEARQINAANGWGLNFDPDTNRHQLPASLALVSSEITEAWTAATPQEANRELGDVIVRALDLGHLIQPGAWVGHSHEFCVIGTPDLRADSWATSLLQLHMQTSVALEHFRKDGDAWRPGVLRRLHVLVATTWQTMTRYAPGQSPELIIREILATNRTRSYRHGGRRL